MGTEHLIHLSGTGDNPVHWIQLLNAFDQPGLQWLPLITHIKLQMLKCDKCLLEFCSPINFRRHARVHHRSSKVNKESQSLRGFLAEFWDECSLEEAKQLVSFDDVMLKETPGSSVIMALASSLLKPEISTLPQVYVNAGAKLRDLIQAPPGLTISSEELFCILDNASEGTFLFPGPAEFVQTYVFYGEATNSLDLRNLVASTSFLFELQLVKAWIAAKDAQALRCQKLLVEEEEAARRRKAKLVEKRKQKKLRQKELKAKDQLETCKQYMNFPVRPSDGAALTEESNSSSPSYSSSNLGDVSADFTTCLSMLVQSEELEKLKGAQTDLRDESANHCNSHSIEYSVHLNCCQSISIQNQQISEMSSWHGLTADQNLHSEPESTEEFNPYTHSSPPNRSTVWTKEHTLVTGGDNLESAMNEDIDHDQQIEANNFELVIGSISVPLNTFSTSRQQPPTDAQDVFGGELSLLDRCASEKLITAEATKSVTNHVACKPTSHDETEDSSPAEGASLSVNCENRSTHGEVCVLPRFEDGNVYDNQKYLFVVTDGNTLEGNLPFSALLAKEFLSQRWKQAVSEDHVKFDLAAGHEPERFTTVQHKKQCVQQILKRDLLGIAEIQIN